MHSFLCKTKNRLSNSEVFGNIWGNQYRLNGSVCRISVGERTVNRVTHAMHVCGADSVESLKLLKFHRKQIAGLDTYRFCLFTTATDICNRGVTSQTIGLLLKTGSLWLFHPTINIIFKYLRWLNEETASGETSYLGNSNRNHMLLDIRKYKKILARGSL